MVLTHSELRAIVKPTNEDRIIQHHGVMGQKWGKKKSGGVKVSKLDKVAAAHKKANAQADKVEAAGHTITAKGIRRDAYNRHVKAVANDSFRKAGKGYRKLNYNEKLATIGTAVLATPITGLAVYGGIRTAHHQAEKQKHIREAKKTVNASMK